MNVVFLRKLQRASNGGERDRLPFCAGQSFSVAKNASRGLYYQIGQAQGKLVRAVVGEIFDVAVDLARAHRHLAGG
jgi:dTDP-4-dehydrorhamnose 3,5-epimerase-like enzyme